MGTSIIGKTPIWVTGAEGYIGRHLSQFLVNQGFAVIGFGRREASVISIPDIDRVAYYGGGLSAETLDAAYRSHGKPSVVYHLAGGATVGQSIADPFSDFEKSVVSTAVLLEFLRTRGADVPLVLASSAAVYGGGYLGAIPVSAKLDPYSPYGHHKRMVENLGKSFSSTYAMPISIVRLFSVYGDGLKKQLLWDLCGRLAAGETTIELGGTGEEVRDWCHVSDVVRLLCSLVPREKGAFKVFNGGTGIGTCVRDIAMMVLASWGGECVLGFSGASRLGDPFSLVAAPTGLPGEFHWQINPAEGVRRYVEWYQSRRTDRT